MKIERLNQTSNDTKTRKSDLCVTQLDQRKRRREYFATILIHQIKSNRQPSSIVLVLSFVNNLFCRYDCVLV